MTNIRYGWAIPSAVQRHKDCHKVKVSIVRIVISLGCFIVMRRQDLTNKNKMTKTKTMTKTILETCDI